MANYVWPDIDSRDTDVRHAIYCSKNGTNTGGVGDTGELQGATIDTIDSVTVAPATGLAVDSSNKNITTIQGVTYAISNVVNVWMSPSANGDYAVTIEVTLSDGRVINREFAITVRNL